MQRLMGPASIDDPTGYIFVRGGRNVTVTAARDVRLTSGFIHDAPFSSLPALTHCGEGVTTDSHVLSAHEHTGFELMYVCRGAYTWNVGSVRYRQQPGDLLFTTPRQRHATASDVHAACHQLWLGLDLTHYAAGADDVEGALRARPSSIFRGFPEVEPLMRGVVLQAAMAGPHREEVVSAYLATLVSVIRQRLAHEEAPGSVLRYSYPVLKAIELMRDHLAPPMSLKHVAAHSGVGVTQLCRRFRDEVGHSPGEYYRGIRLDEARQRLLNPETTIVDTAMSCGFSSSQHLTTLFRERFGATPGQWRLNATTPSAEDGDVR